MGAGEGEAKAAEGAVGFPVEAAEAETAGAEGAKGAQECGTAEEFHGDPDNNHGKEPWDLTDGGEHQGSHGGMEAGERQ